MSNPLAAQLRAIADQLEGGADAVSAGPVLGEGPCMNLDRATFNEYFFNGVCVKDYWRKGDIGCMKGARADDYNQAIVTASYWHGSLPLHMSVLCPPKTDKSTWVECLASAGDVGWIPAGATYRPRNAVGQNMNDWIAAGCPRANAGGAYDNRGDLLPPNQWQAVFERMMNLAK